MTRAVLDENATRAFAERLRVANTEFGRLYPGEREERQPVHTVYIAADTFGEGTTRELGATALRALHDYAPTAGELSRAFDLPEGIAEAVRTRVMSKLGREPVEDLRLDFEDGYGVRPDAEEDAHAVAAAEAIARAAAQSKLPPFIGIRVKPLNEDVRVRSFRTIDIFLSALVAKTGRTIPSGFLVTLAKVTIPEQVAVMAELLEMLESKHDLARGALKLEIMIEVAQAVLGTDGRTSVRELVFAGRGRCVAAHLGTYDYTASCNVTAAHQRMAHPACDFAKQVMQVSLAGTGVFVSDGSTNVLPVGPHLHEASTPALDAAMARENREAVHRAWRLHASDVRRSLEQGFYQGWDLHPAQLVSRYVALYTFFLEALERASSRMRSFVARVTHASADAGVADDAATGQALLNFFLRGMSCGAITDDEARATGLTLEEIRGRSFAKVLQGRRR